MFVACGVSALITALGVFTPNKPMSFDVFNGTQVSYVTTNNQLRQLNRTATQTGNTTLAGQVQVRVGCLCVVGGGGGRDAPQG